MKPNRSCKPVSGLFLTLALAAPLFAGGCTDATRYIGDPSPLSEAAWMTIRESSYTAAEELMAQAGYDLDTDTPILVGTISDIDDIETSSSLGRVIAEQVGSRFVHAGYDVREVRLSKKINVREGHFAGNQAGEYVISRDSGDLVPAINVGAVVFGTYAVGKNRILVNLRLAEPGTGKVIAAHDYSLVNDVEARRLLADDGKYSFFGGEW
jgi:hypothetical protein